MECLGQRCTNGGHIGVNQRAVNTQVAEPHPKSLRVCISTSVPSDANTVSLGTTL